MSNNNAFVDAIIAGAGGGAQTAWLASSNPGTYANFKNAILEIATAVDGLIPTISPGPSLSQINLMESITAAVLSGRFPQNATPGTYADIAQKIVVLYNTLASSLNNVPNVYGGGGGALTNLSNVFWVDYATTVALPDQNGNIETPFGRLAQAIAAVPNNSVLILVPNINYAAEGFLSVAKNLRIIGLDNASIPWQWPTQLMSITVDATALGNIYVSFENIYFTNGYSRGIITLATGNEEVNLRNCLLAGVDCTIGGFARYVDCESYLYSGGARGNFINCKIDTGSVVANGDLLFEGCSFSGTPVITFSTPNSALFDPSSYQSMVSLGGSCQNASVTPSLPIQASVNVVVPGLAAGNSTYVDVDVSSTILAYLQVGHSVLAWPNADMIGAGQAGTLAWARVTGPAMIRCCFTGAITGGSYPIVFAPL